ncbi:hypothetical protein [Denitrificimonas caeni]|uniref:Uncharacterized protein n=1 Tax=Denitrificimonas caeni TaxID=521720 RepID=A0AAF0AJY0_9GAMM|nr:hypothetical protein [Denitrificimonas caeni]WBE24282.1 hypothetical protein O6P33_07800 [Denitrificimonas caeni]
MKKWSLAIVIAGVGGLALAFSLAQALPSLRTTTSVIEVDINDPELNVVNILPAPLTALPVIALLRVSLMPVVCQC